MQQKAVEEPGNEASTGAGIEESLHSSLPSVWQTIGLIPRSHRKRESSLLFTVCAYESVSLHVFQVMSCCMVMLSIHYPLQLLQVVLNILLVHRSLAGTYLL